MNTLGGIGAILGTMLLAKMGGKNDNDGDEAGGMGDGVEVRKMKELSPSTPNAPLDVQAMMSKHAPGAPMTNENINRVMDSAPKESTMLPRGTGPLDPRGPSPSIDPISIDQLTGKKQTFSVPPNVSDAVDRGMQQESFDRGDEYRAGPPMGLPMQDDLIGHLLSKMREGVRSARTLDLSDERARMQQRKEFAAKRKQSRAS